MSTQNNDKSFAGLPCNEQETVICIDREQLTDEQKRIRSERMKKLRERKA